MRQNSWLSSLRQMLNRPRRRTEHPVIAAEISAETLESRVVLSANAVNDGPFTTDEDTALTNLNILGNDSGNSIYLSSIDSGSWGSATSNADNTISYSPNMCNDMPAGATRTETLNYTIMDSDMNSSTATVTITITGVNDAPTAEDDTDNGTMNYHDTVITISTSSVLSNDSDPDFDTLTVSISSATNGTATVNDNGTPSDTSDDFIEFTPTANFVGTATITYLASDGTDDDTDDDTAVITLQVTNSAPSASDDSFSLMEDQEFTAANPGNVFDNDSDSEGDTMTVTLVSGPSDAAIFVLNSDGTFEYRPIPDWFDGSDQFVYEVSDGIDTAQATVTISSMDGGSLKYADAGDPTPLTGHCLFGPSGTYQELGMNDVVTVYDNNDEELTSRTFFQADSGSFSNAADFGTPIGSHHWGDLLMQLDAYVQGNGLINELYIFDHGDGTTFTNRQQQFGVDIITPDMFADLAPLMSPTGIVVLAGCRVGANAAYCNSVADAIGPNITVSATAGKVVYFPRPFARDYWAEDGIWLNFTGTGP